MFTLSSIDPDGFRFRKSNCEWVVALPTPLPEGAVYTGCDLDALTLYYTLDEAELELSYTEEQIEAAKASIL